MNHAERITDRIIFLDGFPNMQVLDPLRIGRNVKEIIDCDFAAEISERNLYQEAATHCHDFKKLRHARSVRGADEGQGAPDRFLKTQLDLITRIGLKLYTQKHVGGLESEEH